MLVYYEIYESLEQAILREIWKIKIIAEKNPNWHDLYKEIVGFPPARE